MRPEFAESLYRPFLKNRRIATARTKATIRSKSGRAARRVFQKSALNIAARRQEFELRTLLNLCLADSARKPQLAKWRAILPIGQCCGAHREDTVDYDSYLGHTGRGHLSARVAPIPCAATICCCDDHNNHTLALAAVPDCHRMGHRGCSSRAHIGHVTLAMWPRAQERCRSELQTGAESAGGGTSAGSAECGGNKALLSRESSRPAGALQKTSEFLAHFRTMSRLPGK